MVKAQGDRDKVGNTVRDGMFYSASSCCAGKVDICLELKASMGYQSTSDLRKDEADDAPKGSGHAQPHLVEREVRRRGPVAEDAGEDAPVGAHAHVHGIVHAAEVLDDVGRELDAVVPPLLPPVVDVGLYHCISRPQHHMHTPGIPQARSLPHPCVSCSGTWIKGSKLHGSKLSPLLTPVVHRTWAPPLHSCIAPSSLPRGDFT